MQDDQKCRFSERKNLNEYCVCCSWGTRLGCIAFDRKSKKESLKPVIPDGQSFVMVGRHSVRRYGRGAGMSEAVKAVAS